jgi:hypothetical protein
MIAFDLRCSHGHSFEGWFKDLESLNEQNSRGMITCPFCKDKDITRVLSPITIKSSHGLEVQEEARTDYEKLAMDVMTYVRDNFHDVGTAFAKEALKMHYRAAKRRNIRGSATAEEEEILKEEGIKFFKIPFVKPKEGEN